MSKNIEGKADKKPIRKFLKEMLSSKTAVSSKRVCGFLGWLVCIFICVYCTIARIDAPDITEILFICSTSLLGLDSITSIWRKEITETKEK